jgi:ComF family protein
MRNRSALGGLADLIWPPRSLLSERLVDRAGVIEPALWTRLRFLGPPQCACCGYPFETSEAEGAVCGACAAQPPAYEAARAALAYDDLSRRLVLELKRAGRRDGLSVFAAWMVQAGGEVLGASDLAVPVPLHWTRLAGRGFNQAAWLAVALGRHAGKPVAVAGLTRIKRRRSQAGLTVRGREANVQGVFRGDPKRLSGQRVLLIDDVFTTGATLAACAKACRRAGALEVRALTLARVVRPVDVLI